MSTNDNLKYASAPYVALNVGTINTDTTTVGTEIDTLGYDEALVIMHAGTVTAGTLTPIVRVSDTAGGTYADVADDFLLGTEAAAALSASNTVKTIGVILNSRYLKLSVLSASSANLVAGATVLLFKGRHKPAA